MLNTAKEIIETCKKKKCHIYDLVLEEELQTSKKTEEEIRMQLNEVFEVMNQSATEHLEKADKTEF